MQPESKIYIRELASTEGFRKSVFYSVLLSTCTFAASLHQAAPLDYFLSIAALHSMVLLLIACCMGKNVFADDIRGILLFDFVFNVIFACSYNIDALSEIYGHIWLLFKPINYGMFMLCVARVAWNFRDRSGRYYAFPPFEPLRWLLGRPYSGQKLPLKMKLLGYALMIFAVIIGQVLVEYQIQFIKFGLYCIPAICGIFWIKRHDREVAGLYDDHEKMADVLCETLGEIEILKTTNANQEEVNTALKDIIAKQAEQLLALKQKADQQTAALAELKQTVAQQAERNAALEQDNTQKEEVIAHLTQTMSAVGTLDSDKISILKNYNKLTRAKQSLMVDLFMQYVQFSKPILELVGKKPK